MIASFQNPPAIIQNQKHPNFLSNGQDCLIWVWGLFDIESGNIHFIIVCILTRNKFPSDGKNAVGLVRLMQICFVSICTAYTCAILEINCVGIYYSFAN